jgi:hypothetical protein
MILLVTPSARGQECAQSLQAATGHPAPVAATLQTAVSQLRSREYSAAVIDQCLLEMEPDESEQMLQHLGTAVPVYVNCAISGVERVVREVRTALSRRQREEQAARDSAEQAIWNELKESVTAILLSCDLALSSRSIVYPRQCDGTLGIELTTLKRLQDGTTPTRRSGFFGSRDTRHGLGNFGGKTAVRLRDKDRPVD